MGTKQLRTYHNELARAVQAELGHRCPCCGNAMHPPRVRRRNATAQARGDRATVAHNIAVAFGGNPTVWVWACLKCNREQGEMSFSAWAYILSRAGDARAGRVSVLADFVSRWCADNGVAERRHRRDVA